ILVGVTRGIDVSVVTLLRLVLNVRDIDRDAALLLLRCIVHLVEGASLVEIRVLIRQDLRDGGGQGGLSVVYVANGTNVYVRLSPFETSLCHLVPPRC